MNTSKQLAKHLREVHFGKNWTWSDLKTNLSDVTLKEATTKVGSLNTIALLASHIHYYVAAAVKVLEGGELAFNDKDSFALPPLNSEADWQELLAKMWTDGERMAELVGQLPEEQLWETFKKEKYGDHWRNLLGTIEHSYYHLGQIAVIKKLIREGGL